MQDLVLRLGAVVFGPVLMSSGIAMLWLYPGGGQIPSVNNRFFAMEISPAFLSGTELNIVISTAVALTCTGALLLLAALRFKRNKRVGAGRQGHETQTAIQL